VENVKSENKQTNKRAEAQAQSQVRVQVKDTLLSTVIDQQSGLQNLQAEIKMFQLRHCQLARSIRFHRSA